MQQASPRKKAPEQVRQSILQHAICLAAEKGVTGVSIQAVADLVGVSKGGVFHHFPNKQKLLEAMVVEQLEQLDRVVDELISQDRDYFGKAGARLGAFLVSYFDDYADGSDL